MTDTKKLPLAISVLGCLASVSMAEIKVNDNLSITGFVDMSANGKDSGDVDPTLNANVDQYEMDFMYKYGFFSARADVNVETWKSNSATLEQAYATAALLPSLSLSTGRFLSSMGFEAAEPTGLYQYSVSKTTAGIYGGYQNGINLAYNGGKFGVYGAVVSDLWSSAETEIMKSPGFEGQVSLMPVEGLTAKAAVLWQMYDKKATATLGDDGQGLVNVWAQWAKGPLTAAAEYNQLLSWKADSAHKDQMGMGWLAMVNYKFTDKFATTLRYSALAIDDDNSATDDMGSEVTISPSFAISPNWLALAEYRIEFGNVEQQLYAVETTFSF
jgi:hypothetical protein